MDVFISYSRKDRIAKEGENVDVISQIQQAFVENGISYWLDEEGIHSGETFASVISRNIAEAKVFLFVSSANSNASRWTCGEIATANSYEKRIIPFKIDQTPYNPSITIYLAALDTIDYNHNKENAIRRLIKSVKLFLTELEAENRRLEEEKRLREEREKIRLMRERIRAENQKKIAQIEVERVDVESKIKSIEERINSILEEKNHLLGELAAVKTEIVERRGKAGSDNSKMKRK